MTPNAWVQFLVFLGALLLLGRPLGAYMARVYQGQPCGLDRILGPVERWIYRLSGRHALEEMNWRQYASAFLLSNLLGLLVVYALQRFQHLLPLDPGGLGPVSPDSSFNTAVSFATNTNWQGYSGETTLSSLTQMLGLAVQNFLSAAAGMACLVALVRGFARHSSPTVGNYWTDLTRGTLYILLPLSFILALALVSQGVVQDLGSHAEVGLLEAPASESATAHATQTLALGPAASQVAIKQLGTNGGGYFNANSAHPFENPTPLSAFLQLLAILLIPAALCFSFGRMVGDARQGRALLAAMLLIFVPSVIVCTWAEQAGNPALASVADQAPGGLHPGGNMEGKEVRFGIAQSALWASATTAASNGSVNSMHDSFTPLGGLVPMVLMQLGEVVFGGVGSGLYGMLVFALIAVFLAGLMVGRTPEYLGKKIESFEMKMAALVILIPPFVVLAGTAVAVMCGPGRAGISNPGPHGFSEVLYAFSSAGNNNGSAFAGLGANTPFYNTSLGLAMLFARYWLAIPTLAIAGALAAKRTIPQGAGTLPTHSPLFVVLLAAVVVIVGALTFFPALALGPIVEQLLLGGS